MTNETVKFLENENSNIQKSIHLMAINFDTMVNELVARGWKRHDAIVHIEAVKRELISQRNIIDGLITKAREL